MADDAQKRPENPLEEVAAEMSAGLQGKTVELSDTAEDRVQGGQIHMRDSAARSVEANALHMENCAAFQIRGGSLEISDSAMGIVAGHDVRLESSNASMIVGKRVQVERAQVAFLIAGKSEGNIRAVLTPLTAAAFGAGFGMVWFVLQTLFRRVRGANKQTKAA